MHLETSCFEMTARKQCFLTIDVLHRHHGYCFGCFFQLFPIIRNIWPHLSSFTIQLYTVSGHSHTLDMAIHELSIRASRPVGRDVTSIVAALHASWPVDVHYLLPLITSFQSSVYCCHPTLASFPGRFGPGNEATSNVHLPVMLNSCMMLSVGLVVSTLQAYVPAVSSVTWRLRL